MLRRIVRTATCRYDTTAALRRPSLIGRQGGWWPTTAPGARRLRRGPVATRSSASLRRPLDSKGQPVAGLGFVDETSDRGSVRPLRPVLWARSRRRGGGVLFAGRSHPMAGSSRCRFALSARRGGVVVASSRGCVGAVVVSGAGAASGQSSAAAALAAAGGDFADLVEPTARRGWPCGGHGVVAAWALRARQATRWGRRVQDRKRW